MNAVKLLGSLLGNNATGGNMLGSLIGGAMGGGGQAGGGGPLGMISGLLGGGGGGQQSGAAGLLGSILGGGNAAQPGQEPSGGGMAGMIGGLLGGGDAQATAQAPPQAATDEATLLIRAMCNAAKADGNVDQQEQDQILGKLGDIDASEAEFLRKELASPLDVAGFANSVPANLAPNVYALSVMTVKVDTPQEAAYLQQLAQGLNLDNNTLATIHKQLGVA